MTKFNKEEERFMDSLIRLKRHVEARTESVGDKRRATSVDSAVLAQSFEPPPQSGPSIEGERSSRAGTKPENASVLPERERASPDFAEILRLHRKFRERPDEPLWRVFVRIGQELEKLPLISSLHRRDE